jgi:aromatic-L-amino-acid/L-tryptophan decarboxylase
LFSSLGESVFFTRKPELVNAALSLTETTQKHSGAIHHELLSMLGDDSSPLLSLSATKLWMVRHCFGQEWLVERLSAVCHLAHFLAGAIVATTDFELLSPVPLCIVCFRAHPEDMYDEAELEALNQRILRRINDTGHAALTHTWLHATFTLRIVLNTGQEQEAYVYDLWEEIQSAMQIEIAALCRHRKNSQHLNMLSLPSRAL